jgi:hypothetical protein
MKSPCQNGAIKVQNPGGVLHTLYELHLPVLEVTCLSAGQPEHP